MNFHHRSFDRMRLRSFI